MYKGCDEADGFAHLVAVVPFVVKLLLLHCVAFAPSSKINLNMHRL